MAIIMRLRRLYRSLKSRFRWVFQLHRHYFGEWMAILELVPRKIIGSVNHSWEYLIGRQNGLKGESGVLHIVQAETWETFTLEPQHIETATHWKFERWRNFLHPSVQVVDIPGGRLLASHHAVITREGTVLRDVSGTRAGILGPSSVLGATQIRVIDEDLLSLVTEHSENYYHFLFDVIPRIAIFREVFGSALANKKFLISKLRQPFQKELIDRSGLSSENLIECDTKDWIISHKLCASTMPTNLEAPSSTTVSRILRTIRPELTYDVSARARRNKIYLKRGNNGNRAVEGEERMESILHERGFESIIPHKHSVAEQIRIFNNASIIVSPHGAALTNLLFCQPGTHVIEVFNPLYVNLLYYRIANHCKLNYSYCLCPGEAWPAPVDPFPCWAPITFDDLTILKVTNLVISCHEST